MSTSPALLEREPFIADLRAALVAADRGTGGRIALVYGEAGIGKTSLARAFAAQVPASGRVLWGGCDPLFTPTPLGPLRDIAAQSGGGLARLLGAGAPRETLFAAFHDELRRHGTVAVIEDVHWADEATLDLLKYAARRIERAAGLLLITYRDDALGPDHPLRVLLGDLPRASTVRLRLSALSETAVAALARAAGRSAEGLHAATDGNPFFVTEALASEGGGVPETVRDAVLSRAARLSSGARAVLDLASIVPGRVERSLVEDDPGGRALLERALPVLSDQPTGALSEATRGAGAMIRTGPPPRSGGSCYDGGHPAVSVTMP